MLTRDEFDELIKKSLQEGKTTFIVRDEDGFPYHVLPQKEYMELVELKQKVKRFFEILSDEEYWRDINLIHELQSLERELKEAWKSEERENE
jgi:hypothetical protein